MKKGLIIGVINLLFSFIVNFLVNSFLPAISAEYQNPTLFRSVSDPLMMVFFAYPFILGFVSYYLWIIVEGKLEGKGMAKAFDFAKMYFIVATIPGMFVTYTSMPYSLGMVLLWALTGFINVYIAGLVFIKFK